MAVEINVKAADKMAMNWFAQVVGKMANCLGEKMVVSNVGTRAGGLAVKTAGWLVVNWVDKMVDQMAACWEERIAVMMVGPRADKMVEKTDVKRAV